MPMSTVSTFTTGPYKGHHFNLLNIRRLYELLLHGVLAASQFPEILSFANGTYHKPLAWG
jgi:hypothetical protein